MAQIKALMQHYGVIKAYLFGSAVVNDMSNANDIDFLVTFNPDLNYTEYGNNYFQLMYALQKLLNKEVDIVAEETITNPYYFKL